MKIISMAFMMVMLIGTVAAASVIPYAAANPGLKWSLPPTMPQNGVISVSKDDNPNSGVHESQFHAHTTLLVEVPFGGSFAVPSNPDSCSHLASVSGSYTVWRLVAADSVPANTELNTGGTADLHLTYPPIIGPDSSHINNFVVGSGAPFFLSPSSTTLAEKPTIETHQTTPGFTSYAGHAEWLKDGIPGNPDTTNVPVGTQVWLVECDFDDLNADKNWDPLSEGPAVTGEAVLVVKAPVAGGEILPIDMTALFVAGAMTNAFWMVPTLGGIAGAAVTLYKIKRKHD